MRRSRALAALIFAVLAAAVAIPASVGAAPAQQQPGQRIDLKVLLLTSNADDAWKQALTREGIPFDTITTTGTSPAVTDDRLADYAGRRAKYQAVIVSTPLAPSDDAAVTKLQSTFGVRRLSDNVYPSAAYGLNLPTACGSRDGEIASLTAAGKVVFPYLAGNVPIENQDASAVEAYGCLATPSDPSRFSTLLTGPSGSSLLGIHTHPEDGREEMVMTVASNATQSHNQLLRHGMLSWVTRGVFLGIQRNYLGLQVDDLFLPDDSWDSVANTTSYDPAAAIRMTAADLQRAAQWSKARGVRIDFAFNGAGAGGATDALLKAAQDNKAAFGWINHTYEHPNLDCSTQAYISGQISRNVQWAKDNGFGALVDPAELVTGEHSGLANTRPGNPGTVDPPSLESATPLYVKDATLAPGAYEYALTASTPKGETTPAVEPVTVPAPAPGAATPDNAVDLVWNAVCHATSYTVYRRAGAAGAWSRVGTVAPATPATDTGQAPVTLRFRDTGAVAPAAAPPAANGAKIDPYAQNPALAAALQATGVRELATDASKAYPDPAVAGNVASTYAPGAQFTDGPARTIPRYPTNVYYNAATREQQLDEYNWLYVAPANGGGCMADAFTTCRTTPATWNDYLASEANIMFRHVVGNDPRPHYFHQTNLAKWDPSLPESDAGKQGGILYAVVDALLNRYNAAFNSTMPLVQLTHSQVGAEIARQDKWRADAAAGRVTGYLEDGKVHVLATADAEVPLTGTLVGTTYGGERSGWTKLKAGEHAVFALREELPPPAPTATPAPGGRPPVTPPAVTPTPQGTAPDALVLAKLRVTPRRFATVRAPRSRGRLGASVSWITNRPATVRLTVERATRKRGARRYGVVARLQVATRGGVRSLRLTRHVSRRVLRPGRYRLRAVATDAQRHSSAVKRVTFTVTR